MLREDVQKTIDKRVKLLVREISRDCKSMPGLMQASDRISNTINKLFYLKATKQISKKKYTIEITVWQRAQKELYKNYLILLLDAQSRDAETENQKGSYRYKARFDITVENIHLVKGYDLLCKVGVYNRQNNPTGVVKDHRFSIKSGKLLGLDPRRLGNINNCEFLTYNDNLKKSSNNSISLEEFNKFCPAYG
jgi:hypothetical protein